jgi:hypothetical protein
MGQIECQKSTGVIQLHITMAIANIHKLFCYILFAVNDQLRCMWARECTLSERTCALHRHP